MGYKALKKNEFRYWGLPPPTPPSFLFLNRTDSDDEARDVELKGVLLWTLCFPLAGRK